MFTILNREKELREMQRIGLSWLIVAAAAQAVTAVSAAAGDVPHDPPGRASERGARDRPDRFAVFWRCFLVDATC
jgi:hypothetical protein